MRNVHLHADSILAVQRAACRLPRLTVVACVLVFALCPCSATAAATKQGVEHLRAAPTTFHCGHCNTLLAVPTGPWACQTCSMYAVRTIPLSPRRQRAAQAILR